MEESKEKNQIEIWENKLKAFFTALKADKKRQVKYIIIVSVIIIVCTGSAIFTHVARLYNDGCFLVDRGEYAAGLELLYRLDRTHYSKDKILEGTYLYGQQLLDEEKYEKAEEYFLRVLDTEYDAEAKDKLLECKFGLARALFGENKFMDAAEIYKGLGNYSDSEDRYFQCISAQYDAANAALYEGNWKVAAELFRKIPEFRDSEELSEYAMQRRREKRLYGDNKVITDENFYYEFDDAYLYTTDLGVIYFPKKINEDTATVLYFPGGDGRFCLFSDSVTGYLNAYRPNAVMLFCFESGQYHKQSMYDDCAETLNSLSIEWDFVIHKMAVIGSSSGCYTALEAVPYFYDNWDLSVDSLSLWDTGTEWGKAFMSRESFESFAAAAPKCYFFEQSRTGLNVPQIRTIAAAGVPVTMVYCTDEDHCMITINAFKLGAVSYVLGQQKDLDENEYRLVELDRDEAEKTEKRYGSVFALRGMG